MTPLLPSAAAALCRDIDARIGHADEIDPLPARHRYIHQLVPELQAAILRLAQLEPDDAVIVHCIAALHAALRDFKLRHAIPRIDYVPELDGHYPLRDDAGDAVHVVALDVEGQPAGADRRYSASAVWPYLDPQASPAARAARYRATLACRRLGPADLRHPGEQALIGQRGVFAVRAIRRGECLGVYGGRLMTAATYFTCLDDSFVLSAKADDDPWFIDGENILAMANTVLAYQGGVPVTQAQDGYNIEAAIFAATTACGRRLALRAFFATAAIAPGEELRWNYRYSPEMVRRVFGGKLDGGLP